MALKLVAIEANWTSRGCSIDMPLDESEPLSSQILKGGLNTCKSTLLVASSSCFSGCSVSGLTGEFAAYEDVHHMLSC